MPPRLKYTKSELEKAVNKSRSIRQVIIALKLNESGGTYITLKKKFKEWKIDMSHFSGQAYLKGGRSANSIPLDDILSNRKFLKSTAVKNKLLKEGLLQYKCGNETCGISTWLDKPTTLELDHIDGNRYNNALTNLKLLCPNCHSQTKTWRRN